MQSRFQDYIRARFASPVLSHDPFPHLVVRDVLPPELYRQMDADCPSRFEARLATLEVEWWHPRKLGGLPIPGRLKRTPAQPMFGLRPNNASTPLLERYARRWQRKYRAYIDLIDELTVEAYQPALAVYMRQLEVAGFIEKPQPLALGQGLFTHRSETWRIAPHVHDTEQIIQSMIYFPLPGSVPEQGTELYRLKGSKVIPGADLNRTLMFQDDEVELAGMLPYHPNTLASFLNTPLAVHASPENTGRPARRYTFTASVMSGVSTPARDVDLRAEFGAAVAL